MFSAWVFRSLSRSLNALIFRVDALERVEPTVYSVPVQSVPSTEISAEYDLPAAWAAELEAAGLRMSSKEVSRQRAMREEAGL